MFHSLLIIFIIIGVFYGLKRWRSLPELERNDFIKKIAIWGGLGVVLALIATGRAHWVTGLLAGLIAIASRVTQLAAYFPILKTLFPNAANKKEKMNAQSPRDMSKEMAAEILGVPVEANADEIRLAHKRLMQKIHPDRGGSEALAKQINQAKDVLIG